MSTYLLAFANGEFAHLESSYKSPLSGKVRPLRIYGMQRLGLSGHCGFGDCLSLATPDVIGQAQYALDIKKKTLPLYEQAFNVEFPLPKLDTLVANDFDAEAMENWVSRHRFSCSGTGLIGRTAMWTGFDHRTDHCFPCGP
jgi:aminopeptidase 2